MEASMHDWRYVTPDAPRAAASNARHGPQRSGLLPWPVVSAAVLVSSCQPAGVLDPGADCVGGTAPLVQLDGNYARSRGSRDPGNLGVRVVVQVVQRPRRP